MKVDHDQGDAMKTTVQTIRQRLNAMHAELYDIAECAEDIGWLAVLHPLEAALGRIENATTAAEQYEGGQLEARD